MAIVADRAKDTSTTTGTGNKTLSGTAPTGYQNLNDAVGLNVVFGYAIAHQSANEWEVGEGYLSASTTLVSVKVTESSNSDALVNFSAGTKDVIITFPADQFQGKGVRYAMMSGGAMP